MPAPPLAQANKSGASPKTQAERSQAMRKRLQRATLDCLIQDGYAKTTVSAVCERAGVSRGAYVHQYASKQELIQDVTNSLLRQGHRRLTKVILEVSDESDRMQRFLDTVWEEIFATPLYNAYMELSVASQNDAELAQTLRTISVQQIKLLNVGVDHYFEPAPGVTFKGKDLFMLARWALGGMANDAHLVDNPRYLRRQLTMLGQILSTQLHSRKGVNAPPLKVAD